MGKSGSRKYLTPWATAGYLEAKQEQSWGSLYANALAGLVTLAVVAGAVLAVVAQFVK